MAVKQRHLCQCWGEGAWKAPLDFAGSERKTAQSLQGDLEVPAELLLGPCLLGALGMSVLVVREVFGALPSNCVECPLVTFPLTLQPLRGASLGCTSGGKQSGPWSALSSPAQAPCGLAPGCAGLCPQEGCRGPLGRLQCCPLPCPRPPRLLGQQRPPERPVQWLSIRCPRCSWSLPRPGPGRRPS